MRHFQLRGQGNRYGQGRMRTGAFLLLCIGSVVLLSGCTAIAVKMVGGTVESLNVASARDEGPELPAPKGRIEQ